MAHVPNRNASSAGALWVAGMGAFLLVAAAATFVAVRWERIPDEVKLAALVGVTLTCLQAHLRLRGSLPVTAGVLLHLGVLLVPIDVAALGVHTGAGWPTMLLAQGATSTVVFGLAAWAERSVVLRAATWLGVVLLAGGIGGLTAAPAGLVLGGIALAAVLVGRWTAGLTAPRAAADHGAGTPAEPPATEPTPTGSAADAWAAGWAVLAGLAMPLAGAETLGVPGAGVLRDLGLTGDDNAVLAGITGLVAGVVLGIVGGRRRSLPAALAGIACVLAGATTAWVNAGPSGTRPEDMDPGTALMAGAALWLLAELAAWTWRADPFWCRPTGIVAGAGELAAAVVTVGYAAVLLAAPFDPGSSAEAALAGALTALTWLAALARRSADLSGAGRPTGSPGAAASEGTTAAREAVTALGPVAAAVAACAAVTLATGSGLATAWALAALGGTVVLSMARLPRGASTSAVLAVGLLAWAPVVAHLAEEDIADGARLGLVAGLGLAGAVMVAAGVLTTTSSLPARDATVPALLLAPLALVPLTVGAVVVGAAGEGAAATGVAIVGVWLVAAILDLAGLDRLMATTGGGSVGGTTPADPGARASARAAAPGSGGRDIPVGLTDLMRASGLIPLAFTLALPPAQAAAVAGMAATLALVDALRRDRHWLLLGTAAATPIVAAGLALDQGTTLPDAGLVVTLTGVAWLGLAGALSRRWVPPALAGAALAGWAGFLLCLEDRAALASYLLIAGTALAAAGVALVERPLVSIGAGVTTIGLWSHLSLADVTASEPYIAPAALLALAAGLAARRHAAEAIGATGIGAGGPAEAGTPGDGGRPAGTVSSWVAYAPSVGLLGGAALAERLTGGPAWHAIVAGAVGIIAVAAGGMGRLAGPLLTGTVLVVAVTVHETLGVTAQFPASIWLGSGGALLLAAGIAMERRDTGPVETGKRLVDLVRDQFD